jgi:hypothetical protein
VITTKLQPLSRELELAVRADLAPQERSKLIAQVAREDIAIIDRENDQAVGTDVAFDTFVDGSRGKALESVNPDQGTIAAVWRLQSDLIEGNLESVAPAFSGSDRTLSRLACAVRRWCCGRSGESADTAANEWVFISTVPYARKIERGQSSKAADGVYESVAAIARQRFGNLAQISFAFRSLSGSASDLGKWASQTRSGGRIRNEARRSDWLQRQPAIVIRMR